MIKIDAQKNCLLSAKLREEGKEWESVGAMREVFEPLIRRDDDELNCELSDFAG